MTGLIALNQQPTELISAEEKMFKDMAGGASYLPRIQLFTAASGLCKSGEFPQNSWGLTRTKDEVVDLGKNVEVVPIGWRFKALDLRSGDVLSYFDATTENWQTVSQLSGVADSNCMSGVEFLLWLTELGEFCTFFAYNKSSKQEAPKIKGLINDTATLTSRFVPNKKEPKKAFQAPVCNKSTTPPASLPTNDEANAELAKFKSAKDSVITTATAADDAATSRVQ